MRRPEAILTGLAVAGMLAVVLLADEDPRDTLFDPRRSTLLTGPDGARGLAEALERLEVPVRQRRRPWFGIESDTGGAGRGTLVALLDVMRPLTRAEAEGLRRFAAGGGSLFLVGANGVERCFGIEVARVAERGRPDSLPLAGRDLELRSARFVLSAVPAESLPEPGGILGEACGPTLPARADTLARLTDGRPVAIRLSVGGGGRVTLVADSRYVSNRDLKETDAGLLVIPWLLASRPDTIVFDEYHQGFGSRGSMLGAAWAWARSAPAGWAMLQLLVAGLVGLAAGAVRFGPALRVIRRQRRSPLEHLDALAAGLQRARAHDVAVRLLVGGLRRRLRPRAGAVRRGGDDVGGWLEALGRGARDPGVRAPVDRVRALLTHPGGDGRVRDVAHAVEDVWEAMTHESWRRAF